MSAQATLRCLSVLPIGARHVATWEYVPDPELAEPILSGPRPFGVLRMGVDSASLLATLQPGKCYRLTLEEVPAPVAPPASPRVPKRKTAAQALRRAKV